MNLNENSLLLYEKVGIFTRTPNNATDKIVRTHEKYNGLKSNRHLKSNLQKSREADFLLECNDLCDVSTVDVLDTMKDEVKNFLRMQRQKGRPGSMQSILAKKQKSGTTTTAGAEADMSDESLRSLESSVENPLESSTDASIQSLTSSLSSISVVDKRDKKDVNYFHESIVPPKRKKLELIDERIAAALYKCAVSGRCVVHLIVAFLVKLNLDPLDHYISYNTIRKRRSKFREAIYDKVKASVAVGRGAIVHFDGKLMSAITGKKKVDRLAVKVTYSRDVDQLIGD